MVAAVIALLAGMLLPALTGFKNQGQTLTCLSRERQITVAWHLYAEDFGDHLPYNLGARETRQKVARNQYLNWNSTVLSWALESDNTNTALLTQGGLGPYVNGARNLYRCPSDRALSDLQVRAGWGLRVRSLSMNAMVGDPGEFGRAGTNVNNPDYLQFIKMLQVRQPAGIFVFIEEHPDSINDGCFLNHPDSLRWSDLPASYHGGAACLSFADGHAQRHRWRFPSTRPPAAPYAAHLPFDVPLSDQADFEWLMQRTSIDLYPDGSEGY